MGPFERLIADLPAIPAIPANSVLKSDSPTININIKIRGHLLAKLAKASLGVSTPKITRKTGTAIATAAIGILPRMNRTTATSVMIIVITAGFISTPFFILRSYTNFSQIIYSGIMN